MENIPAVHLFRAERDPLRDRKHSSPSIGAPEVEERVEELRLEMAAPRASVDRIVSAMKDVHPYEEPAYDVYETITPQRNFGMGALGELPSAQVLKNFLKNCKT